MNTLKFLNPKTGEKQKIRVAQPSAQGIMEWGRQGILQRLKFRRRPTVAEAEDQMLKLGFIRCGLRAR